MAKMKVFYKIKAYSTWLEIRTICIVNECKSEVYLCKLSSKLASFIARHKAKEISKWHKWPCDKSQISVQSLSDYTLIWPTFQNALCQPAFCWQRVVVSKEIIWLCHAPQSMGYNHHHQSLPQRLCPCKACFIYSLLHFPANTNMGSYRLRYMFVYW